MKRLCRHGISLFALVLASPLFASDFNYTYLGGTHDWTDPAAWTGCNGGYPDNSISVSIYSVLLSSGALSLTQPIDIDAYTQTSTSSSTSNGLTGAGSLTTSGLFSGTTGGSTSYRSHILTNGTVTANGGMTLGGSGTKYLGTNTALINTTGQTANFANGTLQVDGTFENQAGAIFESTNNSVSIQGAGLFDNAGTLNVVGPGTLSIFIVLNNTGMVDVRNGLLRLYGSPSHSEDFNALGTGLLDFRGNQNQRGQTRLI